MVIRTLGDASLAVETGSFSAFQTLVRMIKIRSDATDGNMCQDGTEVFESEENKPVLTLEHPPGVVHQSFDEGPLRNM